MTDFGSNDDDDNKLKVDKSVTKINLQMQRDSMVFSQDASGYEDLSLDDEPGSSVDPWSSHSKPDPTSFRSSTASSSFLASGSPGSSRPQYDRYTSSATTTTSVQLRDEEEVPLVLGVAVVDFNHLVSLHDICVLDRRAEGTGRANGRICLSTFAACRVERR